MNPDSPAGMADPFSGVLAESDLARIASSAAGVASRLGFSLAGVLFLSAVAAGSERHLAGLRAAEFFPSARLSQRYGTLLSAARVDGGLEVGVQRPYSGSFGVCTVAGDLRPAGGNGAAQEGVIRFFAAYLLSPAFGEAVSMYQHRNPRSLGL